MTVQLYCIGEVMIELSDVSGSHCRLGVAGDTMNTAVYCARGGVPTGYVTALGSCEFSDRIRRFLVSEDLDTRLISTVHDRHPGLYAISVDDEGERFFTYWRNESAARTMLSQPQAAKVLETLCQSPAVYLSGITLSLFDEAGQRQLLEMLTQRKSAGLVNVFDGNYRPRNWKNTDDARRAAIEALKRCTISLPTFDDESQLFGDQSPEETADRHASLGVAEVVVKHGANGAFVMGEGWVSPTRTVQPTDTTGAGDSFNGGFLATRLNGGDLAASVRAGHQQASIVLEHHGAIVPR